MMRAEVKIVDSNTLGAMPVADGLQVVDVRKSFTTPNGERLEVLRSVTFDVEPGECVAIMGSSGSGKSTLLHLLGGLDFADHGSISLGNRSLSKMNSAELAQFRQQFIGFVFQFHYLLSDLNTAENVALPLFIRRFNRKQSFETATSLLSQVGLADRSHFPVAQLSGGEQQRVAVARAMAGEPKLLLADEPTGNLDALAGEIIGRILTEYSHKHAAVSIIATHNEDLAAACDRVFRLEGGRVYSS